MIYNYSIQNDFPDQMVESNLLKKQISDSSISSATFNCINTNGDDCEICFSGDLSTEDLATLDQVVADHAPALALAKKKKFAEIAYRTEQLIGEGFEFAPANGMRFGLSEDAQLNLSTLYNNRNEAWITWPVNWPSIDKNDVYAIPDAATIEGFFLTAAGTKQAIMDSETPIDDEVRAATTVAEVNAIVDPR